MSTPLQQPANPLEQSASTAPAPTNPTAAAAAPASEKSVIGFQYAASRDDAPDTPNDQAAPAEAAPR